VNDEGLTGEGEPAPTSALRHLRALVILFVGLRLTVLLAREPGGLMQFGELLNFYRVAEITPLTGRLPLIGYWVEYPPLFAYLNLGLHQLLIAWLGAADQAYFYAWALITLAADTGNLWLMHRLGSRLYGPAVGLDLAWAYALLGAPLVFLMWNFEALTALCMLLGLWWLLEGREARSAIAIAAGALLKVMPGLLVPVVWRFRPLKQAARYTGITAALGALAYLPFLLISPPYALASLLAQARKSSWQTVWALIDGNFATGNFGPVAERLDPARAGIMLGNPPAIPGWLTLVAFGGLYAFLFTRPVRRTDRTLVAFFGLTWCVFLLWSKGWSPQWMAMILPLLLLLFPNRTGVLAAVVFSVINFLEWPVLLSRGLWHGLYLTVALRTAFLIGLLAACHRISSDPAGAPLSWRPRREASP